MILQHYGVHHLDNGVNLLLQGDGVQTALDFDLDVKVTVRVPRRHQNCPHRINLAQARPAEPLDDPLFKAMLPLPKVWGAQPLFMLDTTENRRLVNTLLRLSAPSGFGSMLPMWGMTPSLLTNQLGGTNVMPLIFYGCESGQVALFHRLRSVPMAMPRQAIFMLPQYQLAAMPDRLTTNLSWQDLEKLNLENIGAWSLKRAMLSKGQTL